MQACPPPLSPAMHLIHTSGSVSMQPPPPLSAPPLHLIRTMMKSIHSSGSVSAVVVRVLYSERPPCRGRLQRGARGGNGITVRADRVRYIE